MDQYTPVVVKRPFGQMRRNILILFGILIVVQIAIFYLLIGVVWGERYDQWLWELLIATLVLITGAALVVVIINAQRQKVQALVGRAIEVETNKLKLSYNHFKSLQVIAATAANTLSVERVLEAALDVICLTLNDLGIADDDLGAAAYLFDQEELIMVNERHLPVADHDISLLGKQGIVGQALQRGEVTITRNPGDDPELSLLNAFKDRYEVICIPLRTGYALFGVFIVGANSTIRYRDPDLELFGSIADQVVVTLHTSRLGHELMAEKDEFIRAEEAERALLSQVLNEGPSQAMAKLSIRLGFLRGMMIKNPEQALEELKKLEIGSRAMTDILRNIVNLLRPMALGGASLSETIESAVQKTRGVRGTEVRFEGGEFGALLDEDAKPVVRFLVEQGLYDAVQFAESGRIAVNLWRENELFVARVEDNGKNLDADAMRNIVNNPEALNLAFMKERIRRVSGELEAEANPGVGRALTMVVPLDKHGKDRTRQS